MLPHLAQLFVASASAESGLALRTWRGFCLRKRLRAHEAGAYFG